MPVLSIEGADFIKAPAVSPVPPRLQKMKIDQTQAKGSWKCWKRPSRSSACLHQGQQPFRLLQQPARHLGRRHQASDYPKQRLASDDLRQYFDKIDGRTS
jgi:hypothetical protein